ncbi:MAG TPA: AbrB/MazE/SpoVT family DNA-binding domain-containing protein, partial [Candidatus Nanoarchaeia archaeon]|nr:AbrB/MazE/SpoVT family DNA-binding domain-containing protein [Candidatus Nanoarchaeia archaeon]
MPITKMSSKGQVVIPQEVREELGLGEGELFVVIGSKDALILKQVKKPSTQEIMDELKIIAREGKKNLEKKG